MNNRNFDDEANARTMAKLTLTKQAQPKSEHILEASNELLIGAGDGDILDDGYEGYELRGREVDSLVTPFIGACCCTMASTLMMKPMVAR